MTEPSASFELNQLHALVGHREFVRGSDTLEVVHQRFASGRHDFMAVLDGCQLLGLCARRDIGTLLGARFGFALYARAPVSNHLTPDGIRIGAEDQLTAVLQTISARRDEHFYDDLPLVDSAGDFLGLIYVRDLVRLQTTMLMGNIAELEVRQKEIANKNRQMEDDLRMAREVQVAMLPREFPSCQVGPGATLHFAHLYEPAGGVGGDFFDVMQVSESAVGIIICDVMGHGVRSALITAMVRTTLEELRLHAADPAGLLTRLNAHLTKLLQRTGDLIFVTAAYAVVDASSRTLTYAQAGHPTPLRWSAGLGQVSALPDSEKIGGPALGLMDDSTYETTTLLLGEGDRLLFYTDGISEVDNAQGEEFGVGRIAARWQTQSGTDLRIALAGVKEAAGKFAGGKPFSDDVCLVACELSASTNA